MKATRLLTLLALLIGAMSPGLARDVKLSLNKHTFLNKDTLAATVNFIDFDDDPIVGEVYLDIISPDDSVVISAVMEPRADGTYSIAFQLPSNGFDTPEDITKVSSMIHLNDTELFSDAGPIELFIDNSSYLWGCVEELNKMDVSSVTQIMFKPYVQYTQNPRTKQNLMLLTVRTRETFNPKYYFALQVTGVTRSGDIVAGIDTVSLPVVHIAEYFPKDLRRNDNFLQVFYPPIRAAIDQHAEVTRMQSPNYINVVDFNYRSGISGYRLK